MKRIALLSFALLSLAAGRSAGQEAVDDADIALHQAREALAFSLGVQACLYGHPLVEMLRARDAMTAVEAPDAAGNAPPNRFGHVRRLPTPEWADVATPDTDTLLSSAWLELSEGPIVLGLPDAGDRYYCFTFLDARSNTFAVLSRRTRGTKAGRYAIVGPGFAGKVPPGMERVDSPTNLVWLIGRTYVGDASDLEGARSLQDRYELMPLTALGEPPRQPAEPAAEPEAGPEAAESLWFFVDLGRALAESPPPERDGVLLRQFSEIGISAEGGFDARGIDVSTASGLARSVPVAEQILAARAGEVGRTVNGWLLPPTDEVEPGDYLARAVAAYKGLGVLPALEAFQPIADVDDRGRQLDGAHRYVLRFEEEGLPPAGAFWSLTIYDGATLGLVPNALGRYRIGDRTSGLVRTDAGSLEILVQREPPEGRESNWLPAPEGEFYLVLRLFQPGPAVLEGRWVPPPVERVE